MKISRITAYQVDLPLHEGSYKWSGGKSVAVFDSTVVAVETDVGITGFVATDQSADHQGSYQNPRDLDD